VFDNDQYRLISGTYSYLMASMRNLTVVLRAPTIMFTLIIINHLTLTKCTHPEGTFYLVMVYLPGT